MTCVNCNRDNRADANFCDGCGRRLSETNGPAHQGLKGPLDGIRVIDWTMWQFGPVSTMMLADMGAEVIKVESLDGDQARQFHRVSGAATVLPGGLNAYFESLNRQKLSVALDLKNPRGTEIMYQLAKKSDVFIQNFRQGVAERLNLGYEDLHKQNPMLVYGAGTGYGPNGPDSGKPAFAYTGEARSGSLWWAGPNDGKPYNLQSVADQIAGIMLSYGVLGGLISRDKLGFGQKVDVSHLGSLMWLGGNRTGIALLSGNTPQRQDRSAARNVLWNAYRCKDELWIAFSMNQSDRYWPAFCKAINKPELLEDDRFNDMEARADNREELILLLDDIFLTRVRADWAKAMDDTGGIIWAPVQDVWDLPNDPQVIENNYIVDFDHDVLGKVKYLQTPVGYSDTPLFTRKSAPQHGEDTENILIDLLGYTWDDIASLQDDRVIL
ncbi:MAG: CoA transferase [Chloroflexi bacterium]|nr:CoA transferase [Chloroflexota bacterium]MCI0812367.1 CoA transferase [Chloroflexota bacterium]